MEEGPRQAQALAFPAREGIPQLAHGGIIALGQAHDEVVNRRLAAGLLDLGIGGVPFGDAQIAADGIVEEDGFLGDIAFHPAQVLGVDLIDGPIRDCDAALPGLPETHEQLEQRGFAAAAASHNAGDAAFGDGKGQILEDGFLPVGESHMADLRAGEGNLFPAGHILHGRGFLQQIQHAVACRKGVLQRAAQIGQRHKAAPGHGDVHTPEHLTVRGIGKAEVFAADVPRWHPNRTATAASATTAVSARSAVAHRPRYNRSSRRQKAAIMAMFAARAHHCIATLAIMYRLLSGTVRISRLSIIMADCSFPGCAGRFNC